MTILRPIFGRGVAQRRLGAEVPEFRQKLTVLLGAPVVPKAQIWNSKKICLGPPPPPLNKYNKQLSFSKFLLLVIVSSDNLRDFYFERFLFCPCTYIIHALLLRDVRSFPKYIVLGTKIEVDGPSGARGIYYGELFIILT